MCEHQYEAKTLEFTAASVFRCIFENIMQDVAVIPVYAGSNTTLLLIKLLLELGAAS